MMVKKGDLLVVPLINGKFVLGQIIRFDKRGLHSISFGLFDVVLDEPKLSANFILDGSLCFSTMLVLSDCMLRKGWAVIGNQKLKIPKKNYPYEKELKKRGVGASHFDYGACEQFVNAFYALIPWDCCYRPDLLDELLLSAEKKPQNLIYKNK